MSALVEYLVTNRVVSFLQMDAAVQRVRREGGRLSTGLLEEVDIDARSLMKEIGRFSSLAIVDDEMLGRIDRDLILSWSASRARRLGALPLRIDGHDVHVAVLELLTDLERGIIAEEYGCDVHQYLIPEFRFFELLGRYYGTPVEGRFLRLATRFPLDEVSLPALEPDGWDDDGLALVAERHDSLDDVFDQSFLNLNESSPEGFVSEESDIQEVRDQALSGAEASERADGSVSPSGSGEQAAAAQGESDATENEFWAEVKEESGLLEIPDLNRSPRTEPRVFSSTEVTPGGAEVIEVPDDPDAPLASASWTLERLSEFYQSVGDRDQALWATIGFMRRFFSRRMFLRFEGDTLVVHAERGFRASGVHPARVKVRPLSGLDAMRQGRDYFHGTPEQIGLDRLYKQLNLKPAVDMIVLPVTIAKNTVMFFVGDDRDQMIDSRDLALAFVVRRQISDCLELLLLREKRSHGAENHPSMDELRRERKVIRRLSGNFAIPEIRTEDRGIVGLPTEGWDLPETFDEAVEREEDETRVSIGGPVPRANLDSRFTPEYGDQDIVQQVSEDSGWFDIDVVGSVSRNTDRKSEKQTSDDGSGEKVRTRGFVPRALSREPRSDSFPSLVPALPEASTRQEETTASFKAISGLPGAPQKLVEVSQPLVHDAPNDSSPSVHSPDGASPDSEWHERSLNERADSTHEDEHDTLNERDGLTRDEIERLQDAGAKPSSVTGVEAEDSPAVLTKDSSATSPTGSLEEAFAREYADSISRGANDTRELSVATASRLLKESSDAGYLPGEGRETRVSKPDVPTLTLTPEMAREQSTTTFDTQSGSQPRVETLRTRERPAAAQLRRPPEHPSMRVTTDAEITAGSELINLRQMRRELEDAEQSPGPIDEDLATILKAESDDAVVEAAERIISRPPANLPYLANIFPGPLWLDRRELEAATRPVYEHGPLLRIIHERLPVYVEQLWACIEQSNADARYYSLRLLAFVRELSLKGSLLEAIFDRDNDVRRLALQLIHNHMFYLDINQVTHLMKAGLESESEHLVLSSIVALIKLRSVEAVPNLISLLDHENEIIDQRAREGLLRLTFESSSLTKDQWTRWYDARGDEPAERWLTRAMTSDDHERRTTASKFLQRMTRLAVNYHADIGERQRRIARRTVEQYFGITPAPVRKTD